jgi:uncharacterized protein
MRYFLTFFGIFIILACSNSKTATSKTIAEQPKPTTKHEIFEYKEGDTTYVMQKYFLVLLKKGSNRTHDATTAAEIQKQHMEHLTWLDKLGKVSVVGPSQGHETVAGFVLFNTETLQEADSLAKLDPAVKAGRLEVETIPWWAAKGSKLK